MKKILFKLLLFAAFMVLPVVTYASGGISLSPTSLTVEVGKTRTFTISAINTNGSVTLSSSNSDIAAINTNSWDINATEAGQTKSLTVTVTGVSEGNATISIDVNATTFDEEVLEQTKTVTVVVKSISSNNNLASLKVDDVSVPNFNPATTNYNIETTNASVNIAATLEDTKATLTGTGTKSLKYGSNSYEIKVTAENGNVKTYTLNITRKDIRDSNNYLKSLSTSIGTIAFNKETLKYTLSVGSNVEKIIITAEAESNKSKVTGNGEQTLKYGENKLEVKVTAENETLRTYVITVNREDNRDNNCYLKSLAIDRGTINFSKDVLSYALTVQYDAEDITITALADSDKAKVTGDGEKKLKDGVNKFEVKVTAENETVKVYTITITRLEKDNTKYIKTLTIDGIDFTFDPDVLNYNITLGDEQTELNFNYELEEGILASIEGNENLKNGSIVILKVTKGEKNREYIFNIKKAVPAAAEVTEKKGSNIKKWIIIGVIALVLLAVIGAIASKKKKNNKKPEPESAEIPTLNDMGTSDPTLYTQEPQSTPEMYDNNMDTQNPQPTNDMNAQNNENNIDNLGV